MPKAPNLTSYTELSTLANCEMKWWLRYKEHIKGEQSEAMFLGSLMGKLCDAFTRGDPWRSVAQALWSEYAEAHDLNVDVDVEKLDIAPWPKALWLMARYERHYASDLGSFRVVAQEQHYKARIPSTKQTHEAYIDEVWEDHLGRLWVVERKTYGRNTKSENVWVDPQLTLNLWVAKAATGIEFAGIVWDGIYTYQWKPDKPTQGALIAERIEDGIGAVDDDFAGWTKKAQQEWARGAVERHPGVDRADSESFERLWMDRTPEHIDAALKEVRGAVRRREALRRGATPLRNIGPLCGFCDGKSTCFSRLAFPQDDIVIVED